MSWRQTRTGEGRGGWTYGQTRAGRRVGPARLIYCMQDPHPHSQPDWLSKSQICLVDFTGTDPRSPTEMAAAQHEVRGMNSPYSRLRCSQPQSPDGYREGQLGCLFQHKSGLGSLHYYIHSYRQSNSII